jgi:hypothetical protein
MTRRGSPYAAEVVAVVRLRPRRPQAAAALFLSLTFKYPIAACIVRPSGRWRHDRSRKGGGCYLPARSALRRQVGAFGHSAAHMFDE